VSDEIERIERELLKKRPEGMWRIKKIPAPNLRVMILRTLYKKGEPMTISEIAFELGMSYGSIRDNIRVLSAGNIICDRLVGGDPRKHYYTICPVCPLKDECEFKGEMAWKNTSHAQAEVEHENP